ncbi:thiamine phosphate synthase [Methylacidiphilum caldifontis]|uniref:Thiamine-phosphate synthase n=1 Tax=Methylacidiphilum caldifontis TaxID=2795386 RepID=A0A4Y8PG58_9BACT|nr:thiamine phosphate synthase [Methylacidiphilum caldifontis]QSR88297.1 thiamine phosphate synthase [Methylacidiphilum caldifontis]TFE70608.1 thiamine-phosphate diphosphorylase [Methylacidiphilum caldifontis]
MKQGALWKRYLLSQARFYGILDLSYVDPLHAVNFVQKLVEGKVDILQLRAKTFNKKELLKLSLEIKPLLAEKDILFIINDHPDVALESRADGVHLGQEDMPVPEARTLLGDDFLIGKSTHSVEQAEQAASEQTDYIAFGPIFKTPTKPDYSPVGLTFIPLVRERIKKPVFFIGGINKENISEVLSAGADRVVMVSALLKAADIPAFCQQIRNLLSIKGLWV